MRQITLDTETTGLEPAEGHRIIEIGCVELLNRRRTSKTFHCYLNPDRDIDEGAIAVHGITRERLADSPRFGDIAQDLIAFVRDAEVIIHNAPFDIGFIDHEFRRLGKAWGKFSDYCKVTDTLALARELHPGQRNNLDALCNRYQVDNTARELHGALLDAEILSDVYLRMTGGQATLLLEDTATVSPAMRLATETHVGGNRPALRIVMPSAAEREQHNRRLAEIDRKSGGHCLWKQLADAQISIPSDKPDKASSE